MSKPLALSDDELSAIFAAATPLAVDVRYEFVRTVAAVLATCPEIGPGLVHRVCAETQRRFFTPPTVPRVPAKWARAQEFRHPR
jgi:hypothetical protein